jgi:hypothetical protein
VKKLQIFPFRKTEWDFARRKTRIATTISKLTDAHATESDRNTRSPKVTLERGRRGTSFPPARSAASSPVIATDLMMTVTA